MKQNTVPYERSPEFLSPTALELFETFPVRYYLQYLGPVCFRPARFAQTEAMAYGSAFDGEVKWRLARECNSRLRAKKDGTVRSRDFFRSADYGLKKFLDRKHKKNSPMLQRAARIVEGYWNGPPASDARKHGAELLEDDPKVVKIGEVPLYGKIDLLTGEPRIVDFKVTGAASRSPISPIPGYAAGWTWDPGTLEYKEIKARSKVGAPLESIKPEWATQLSSYDLILTRGEIRPAPVGIDQVTFRKDGRIVYTQVRTVCTEAYVASVLARYHVAWDRIKSKTVLPEHIDRMGIDGVRMMVDFHE